MPDDVLTLTAGMPTRTLAAGETLFAEGDLSSTVVVLVEGEVVVDAGGVIVNRLNAPGSFVGETAALLGSGRTATVTAVTPSTVRELGDPRQLFDTHPQLALEVSRQLAGRLHRLTAYVADVQRQFGDRDDHLGVFAELLGRIAAQPPLDIEPGSDRSPDY